jgi:hypothetical protein
MATSQRDLDLLDRHIAEAEELIGRQCELMKELRTGDSGTIVAEVEQLLLTMRDGLEDLKEHRRVIIEDLQRSIGS